MHTIKINIEQHHGSRWQRNICLKLSHWPVWQVMPVNPHVHAQVKLPVTSAMQVPLLAHEVLVQLYRGVTTIQQWVSLTEKLALLCILKYRIMAWKLKAHIIALLYCMFSLDRYLIDSCRWNQQDTWRWSLLVSLCNCPHWHTSCLHSSWWLNENKQ